MDRRSFLSVPAGVAAATTVISPQLAQAQGADARAALAASSILEEIKKRGTIRVGLSTFVPWVMRGKTGDLIGFEVDVVRQLAQDFGWTMELVPTAWDGIIPALLAGRFDVIISGMAVTAPRLLTVTFTEPYQTSGLAMFAHKELAKGFSRYEDFNKPEVTISSRRGTPAVAAVQRVMPRATLRQFDDDAYATQEVLNGRAHAMIGSIPLPAHTVRRNPDKVFLPVEEPLFKWFSGFVVRKGDPDAVNLFDNWIRLRTTDNFIQTRHAYWFQTLDWEDQVQTAR